ncbi:MAG: hypothetical protein GPOALKHO_001662 [Sodalis sp.]|nr:MAG: hypothetical protein GPOALKHO_001662 [Sodalis sp.]
MGTDNMLGIGSAHQAITGRKPEIMDETQLSEAEQTYNILHVPARMINSVLSWQALQSSQEIVGMAGGRLAIPACMSWTALPLVRGVC